MAGKAKKFAYIPIVVLLGAYSWFFSVLLKRAAKESADNVQMEQDSWGWTGTSMQPHWDRLFLNPNKERWVELVKNIGSEWARLDAERAYKVSAFNYLEIFILGLLIGAILF